jgi:Ser/Thr protein kinase RdoA (MazF antagonist)
MLLRFPMPVKRAILPMRAKSIAFAVFPVFAAVKNETDEESGLKYNMQKRNMPGVTRSAKTIVKQDLLRERHTTRPAEVFPVTYSTLSADALGRQVLSGYALDTPVSCEYMYRGLNDNYLVNGSRTKYVLRVYRHNWRDLSDIEAETELIRFLHSEGIGVSFPLPDGDGRLIREISAPEGIRYAVLFSYAEGSPPLPAITREQSRAAGRELSRMHRITINKSLGNNRCHLDTTSLLYQSFHAIKPFLEDSREDLLRLDEVVSRLAVKFERISLDTLSFGICHGDLYPSNFHISRSGKITFFDFDACCCSWFVMDIAAFCFAATQTYKYADRINRAFIEGYKEIRPLKTAEIELIPYFGAVNRIWVLATQCSNFEIFSRFTRMNIKYNVVENLKRYVEKYCE